MQSYIHTLKKLNIERKLSVLRVIDRTILLYYLFASFYFHFIVNKITTKKSFYFIFFIYFIYTYTHPHTHFFFLCVFSVLFCRMPSFRGRGGGRGRYQGRGRGRGNSRFRGVHRPTSVENRTAPPNYDGRPDDIVAALSKITETLASLSNRLDIVEQNGGPDKKSDRNKRSNKTTAGPPTTQNTSNNDDFAAVSKCLYRIVQLHHHNKNWEQLPRSISERLQRLATDINPPLADDDFRCNIRTATERFSREIVGVVQTHLQRKLAAKETEAAALDPSDLDRAKSIAAKYVDVRLGKRLESSRRTQLLDRAAASIGHLRQSQPLTEKGPQRSTTSPPPSPANNEWIEVNGPGGRRTAKPPPDSRKRALSTPQTTPVTNRFEVLSDDESSRNDVEPDDLTPRPSPTRPAKKPKTKSSAHSPTKGKPVNIFIGPKSEWKIVPRPETTSIIVGDSNLRHATDIPDGWEVHCLPGARFDHVAGALHRLERTGPHKYTVAIQAGINHRNDSDEDALAATIDDLCRLADNHSSIQNVFHVGISATSSMSHTERDVISNINDRFKFNLSGDYCSLPLRTEEVQTLDDRHGIHYTPTTIDNIVKSLIAKTRFPF